MAMQRRLDERSQKLLRHIGYMLNQTEDPALREDLKRAYGLVKGYKGDIEALVEEITQMGVRNGAFPGDMIGWLDDDFTYEDNDEDDDHHKK